MRNIFPNFVIICQKLCKKGSAELSKGDNANFR